MDRRLLHIYLSDHLSAMAATMRRLRSTMKDNAGTELEAELERNLEETRSDREALLDLMNELGLRRTRAKLIAAQALERLGRMKLNGRLVAYSPLSRLEELELFAVTALLRAQLWQTLRLQEGLPIEAGRFRELEEKARAGQLALVSLHEKWARTAFN